MTELWPTAKVELFSEALCLLHPARCRFTQSIGTSAEGAPARIRDSVLSHHAAHTNTQ